MKEAIIYVMFFPAHGYKWVAEIFMPKTLRQYCPLMLSKIFYKKEGFAKSAAVRMLERLDIKLVQCVMVDGFSTEENLNKFLHTWPRSDVRGA